jgi:glycosyltransferase involved in cell wall biosynthesis
MTGKLWVVMPAYNEEACLRDVADEWLQTLKQNYPDFIFLAFNDGSKDSTLAILNSIASKEKNFRVVDKLNSGHGQTCLEGYRIALKEAAEWILQIDSDGQCDPVYFESFLNKASEEKIIYGWRKSRDEGWRRLWISRFVTFSLLWQPGSGLKTVMFLTGSCTRPRWKTSWDLCQGIFISPIFSSRCCRKNILGFPGCRSISGTEWGGTASVKTYSFVKHGMKLFRQLRAATPR